MVLRWPKGSDARRVNQCESEVMEIKLKMLAADKAENPNRLTIRPGIKVWMARAITTAVLWTIFVQLIALRELLGPTLLKGMPYCFSSPVVFPTVEESLLPAMVGLPPKRKSSACQMNNFFYVVLFMKFHIFFFFCSPFHKENSN